MILLGLTFGLRLFTMTSDSSDSLPPDAVSMVAERTRFQYFKRSAISEPYAVLVKPAQGSPDPLDQTALARFGQRLMAHCKVLAVVGPVYRWDIVREANACFGPDGTPYAVGDTETAELSEYCGDSVTTPCSAADSLKVPTSCPDTDAGAGCMAGDGRHAFRSGGVPWFAADGNRTAVLRIDTFNEWEKGWLGVLVEQFAAEAGVVAEVTGHYFVQEPIDAILEADLLTGDAISIPVAIMLLCYTLGSPRWAPVPVLGLIITLLSSFLLQQQQQNL